MKRTGVLRQDGSESGANPHDRCDRSTESGSGTDRHDRCDHSTESGSKGRRRHVPRQAPRRRFTGLLSGIVLLLAVSLALLAPFISLGDPLQIDIVHRLQPPVWMDGGTTAYLLGTDGLGRDLLSRILYGTSTSLTVSGLAVALGTVLGSCLGLAAGYARGADLLLGRVADIQQALPFIVPVLAVAAVTGPSLTNVVLILGVGSWVVHYRIVRAATKAVREEPYVEAARALGLGSFGIVRRHVLPNVLPVIIVNVTTFVPQLMLFEAALSFLGLGVPPPAPTWGGMIAEGRAYVEVAWWMSVFPGLALMITVAAVHGAGEWLTERLDPKRRGGG